MIWTMREWSQLNEEDNWLINSVWKIFYFMKYYRSFISGLQFFETSAKENINVKAVFEKLVEIICDKMAESLDKVILGMKRFTGLNLYMANSKPSSVVS